VADLRYAERDMAAEPCFTHTTRFRSASIEVKSLECASPADPVGFQHEYEASRISLVRSGLFGRVVRGASLLADSSQALLVNRGDVHRFVYPVGGGNACTVLEPSRATLSALHRQFSTSAARFPVDQASTTRRVAQLHGSLLQALEHGRPADRLATEDLALQLCSEVVNAATRDRRTARAPQRAAAERRQRQIVDQVRLELFRRLQCPPTLTELAGVADCSAFHLSRLFTTYVGMPMRSYLVRVRAGEAARRVLEGADDFAALALELGFYDHSHFTNAFVAVWGVTPSMFRESRRSIVRLRATTSKRLARRSS
jgi:AraC family transcriptional regulator